MRTLFWLGLALCLFVPSVDAQQKYKRGRVAPKNLAALKQADIARHGPAHAARLPQATAAQFDCVALGWVCPVLDQLQCGSCWDYSGTEMCTSSFIKAGMFKNDGSFILSTQYTLDCYNNGGCNGDDNTTVLAHCKSTGLPTQADYGPYTASSNRCRYTSAMKLFQISDWGFCTPTSQNGVANTQDIKNCMVAYGAIGSGIDASNLDGYRPGQIISGNWNSGNIDHDILIVGWDDTKGKAGAWKVQNSWGESWGDKGYFWIEYTSYGVGTEGVYSFVSGGPPPCPNPPCPPPPPPPPPPPATFSVTIPAQTITFSGPLGRTYSAVVPSQTVTGQINPPQKSGPGCASCQAPPAMPSVGSCGSSSGNSYNSGYGNDGRRRLFGRLRRR